MRDDPIRGAAAWPTVHIAADEDWNVGVVMAVAAAAGLVSFLLLRAAVRTASHRRAEAELEGSTL